MARRNVQLALIRGPVLRKGAAAHNQRTQRSCSPPQAKPSEHRLVISHYLQSGDKP
jgi:hypothetical protein